MVRTTNNFKNCHFDKMQLEIHRDYPSSGECIYNHFSGKKTKSTNHSPLFTRQKFTIEQPRISVVQVKIWRRTADHA